MTQEEKANAYDEALALMQDCIPDENGLVHVRPYEIFLELRESEDEKIRNEIIESMRHQIDRFSDAPNVQKKYEYWIAWLEKQGETYTKEDVDDAYIKGIAFAKNELEKQNKQIPKTCKDEQKPVDNDLEYASEKYACRFSSSKYGHDKVKDVFIAGAQWRKEHLWKPSDEQMEALHDLNLTGNISYAGQGQELINLYNDLKKIKE